MGNGQGGRRFGSRRGSAARWRSPEERARAAAGARQMRGPWETACEAFPGATALEDTEAGGDNRVVARFAVACAARASVFERDALVCPLAASARTYLWALEDDAERRALFRLLAELDVADDRSGQPGALLDAADACFETGAVRCAYTLARLAYRAAWRARAPGWAARAALRLAALADGAGDAKAAARWRERAALRSAADEG